MSNKLPVLRGTKSGKPQIVMFMTSGTSGDISSTLISEDKDGMVIISSKLSEEEKTLLQECYAGPNDPRLPDDVKAMPVGQREDFVDEFNFQFYFYWKDDDVDYDENVTKDANRVRFATNKAYEFLTKKAVKTDGNAEGRRESLSGPGESRIREMVIGGCLDDFQEKESGGYTNSIVVIEQGWSLNGHYWSEKAVRQVAEFCNDKVVGYFNHGDTFGRDPRDWGIVTESGTMDGKKAVSKIHVFQSPDGDFLRERIDYARNNDANHLFGISVDSLVKVEEGEAEGREGTIVTECVRLNSVDVVMMPAAKGRFNAKKAKESVMAIDAKTVKEQHAAVAAELHAEGRVEMEAELKASMDAVKAELEGMKTELAKAQAELDAYKMAERQAKEAKEAAEKQAAFESELDGLLAVLPKEKVSEAFVAILKGLGQDKLETIKSMIEERKTLVITPVITGEGVGGDGVIESDQPKPAAESLPSEEARLALFKQN